MTPTTPRRSKTTKWLASGAVALGLGLGAAGLASAATEDTSNAPADTTVVAPASGDQTAPPTDGQLPPDGSNRPDPATVDHGPGETVLTGDIAAKVTAAAEAAEPGATVIRVESDNEGHTYEAHVQLADGSYRTLYFDESFNADGSIDGFGTKGPGGPGGHHGPHGDHDGDGPVDGQAPTDGSTTGTTDGVIDGGPADSTATTTAG